MLKAVPVLELLTDLAGAHPFRDMTKSKKEMNHSNCVREIERKTLIECRNGSRIEIPAGSTVVIYRHPLDTWEKKIRIACIHYPGAKLQTVVYTGGRCKTQDLRLGSTLGYIKRRSFHSDALHSE